MRVNREEAAENRERIVEAAARLFREHGFDGASSFRRAITSDNLAIRMNSPSSFFTIAGGVSLGRKTRLRSTASTSAPASFMVGTSGKSSIRFGASLCGCRTFTSDRGGPAEGRGRFAVIITIFHKQNLHATSVAQPESTRAISFSGGFTS